MAAVMHIKFLSPFSQPDMPLRLFALIAGKGRKRPIEGQVAYAETNKNISLLSFPGPPPTIGLSVHSVGPASSLAWHGM